MFTEAQRTALLTELLDQAHADPQVTAAAVVGSGAHGATDRWSDIDLALRLVRDADVPAVADAWQLRLASSHEIVDTLDIWAGGALYRVILLANSLQIDLSFWPDSEFRSNGEPFQLVFGDSNDPVEPGATAVHDLIGWAWLYALHARSAIARNRPWQALQMIDGLRDRLISLACLRHGLPAHQGRGVDQLPELWLAGLAGTMVGSPTLDVLEQSFAALVDLLADEVEAVDPQLAVRLRPVLTVLVETAKGAGVGRSYHPGMEMVRVVTVFDAADLHSESAFWAGMLGGHVFEDDAWHSVIDAAGEWRVGVQLAPDHVPPQWPDGAPQQVHLDLHVEDVRAAHAEAISLGARLLQAAADLSAEEGHQVYADPAGHPFCIGWGHPSREALASFVAEHHGDQG